MVQNNVFNIEEIDEKDEYGQSQAPFGVPETGDQKPKGKVCCLY